MDFSAIVAIGLLVLLAELALLALAGAILASHRFISRYESGHNLRRERLYHGR